MTITPHLNFNGQARQALAFYQSVLGGKSTLVTYRNFGNVQDPAQADQIVWGQVESQNGLRIMAFDVAPGMPWEPGRNAFFVSLRGDTAEEISALWSRLSAGASILQDLAPSQWSPLYGMLKDRFGVVWVLDVQVVYPPA